MSVAQIIFLVLWPLLSLISIVVIYKSKKYNGMQNALLSIMLVIIPVAAALCYLLFTYRTQVSFWSNSATKDNMWLAESDISHGSSGDSSSGGSSD